MATTIGSEYEHIDFTHNNITTRHPIKDATARSMVGDIVKISDSDPQLPNNKIWIKETPNAEVQVPTYAEFQELDGDVEELKSALQNEIIAINNPNGYISNPIDMMITGSNLWGESGSANHIMIPVNPGDIVEIKANSLKPTLYSVLREFDVPVSGAAPKFSTVSGYTQRMPQINKGTTCEPFTAPSDARYLCFNYQYSGNSYYPASIKINGIELRTGVLKNIRQDISSLQEGLGNSYKYREVTAGADLDTITESGYYVLAFNASYINTPDDNITGRRILYSYSQYVGNANSLRFQLFTNISTGKIWMRFRAGGQSEVYGNWKLMNPETSLDGIFQYMDISAGTDLDTLKVPGYYVLAFSGEYNNQPWDSGRRALFVYPGPGTNPTFVVQLAVQVNTGDYAFRLYIDSSWSSWKYLNDAVEKKNHIFYSNFSPARTARYIFAKGKMWEKLWNTAEAFEAAAEDERCWGIDGDVQFTIDGHLVMYHDATVSYNGSTAALNTLSYEQVQSIVLTQNGNNYKIPDFESFLDICRENGKMCFVETKASTSAYSWTANNHTTEFEAMMALICSKGMQNNVVMAVATSDITYLKAHYPDIAFMRIMDANISDNVISTAIKPENRMMIVSGYPSAWTAAKVSTLHENGRLAITYTQRPQSDSDVQNMLSLGADGVFVFRNPPEEADANTTPYVYINEANTSVTPNIGQKIRVLTYNIGRYNNGSETRGMAENVFNEKVFNLKKFLMKCGADYCAVQEDIETCDRAQTKNAHSYIYKPLYPFRESYGAASCYGKDEPTSSGRIDLHGATENRYMSYQFYSINQKTLLFISLHASYNTFENRAAELADLFAWIGNQTYDWCIIAGDFNLLTTNDHDASVTGSLPYFAEQNHFTLANGGYLGWLFTTPGESIDNILCSEKCIINNIECFDDWYQRLCSDHYPLLAEITLLD